MAKDPRIATVQKVLYEPRRLQHLKDDLVTIEVMMNLDPRTPLQPTDIRGFAGSGPDWWIRGSGAPDLGVVEGAKRCDAVAAKFLAIRADLAHVAFPAADKAHLRRGLAELAAFWTARAKAWRAAPGQDVDAAVAGMQRHLQASAVAFRKTRKYLKKNVRLG